MSAAADAAKLLEELALDADEGEAREDLVPETIHLDVAYTDSKTLVDHVEVFACTVLGPKARLEAEAFAGLMARPFAWDLLPTPTQNRFLAFGHVVFALGLQDGLRRKKPSWLVDALEEDDDLLALLDAEVRGHRARRFRGDAKAGGTGAQRRLLRVTAVGRPRRDASAPEL